MMILRRLPLHFYLWDVAQKWFEPGISGLTNEPPVWLDNLEAFLDELCSNFGPFDKTGNTGHELINLHIKDNQHVTDYQSDSPAWQFTVLGRFRT